MFYIYSLEGTHIGRPTKTFFDIFGRKCIIIILILLIALRHLCMYVFQIFGYVVVWEGTRTFIPPNGGGLTWAQTS